MAQYTLDELLIEVNKVAQAASEETLRDSVTKQLIHVYRRVAAPALYQPGVLGIEPTPYQSVELPATMIRLIDVRSGYESFMDRGVSGNMNRFGKMVVGQPFTDYDYQNDRLWFTKNCLNVPLTVTYWSVPVDRQGSPTIDDKIWTAAVLYCQGEAARVALHFKNKQSYSAAPMQFDFQLAKTEMDAARADCNELADPDFVKLYESMSQGRETTQFLPFLTGRFTT